MQLTIDVLRATLAQRPHPQWGKMGPELSYGRHRGPARPATRRAAVLIALYQLHGQWWLPLTVRHPGMSRHQGQISLPGGLIEPGEASRLAALREFGEELGPTPIEVIGLLNDCYVYVSDTLVSPWVGILQRPRVWQPNPQEVERVIEMPVSALTDPATRRDTTIRRGPLQFSAPGFALGGDHVWGATAVILEQLANLLRPSFVATKRE